MTERAIVVLDCGKTLAKLSMWRRDGTLLAREARPNVRVDTGDYDALDASGIEQWLAGTLRAFSSIARIGAIIPVAHGAAAVILRGDRLACLPPDYEQRVPLALRREYELLRGSFAETGSPSLPDGLNLGVQLFQLEADHPDLLGGDELIMPWAQYWSWLLCGVPAVEVTSLGCHTDLWCPREHRPSTLAQNRGWARHFPRLAQAGEVLGTLTPEWVARTGLASDVTIHCGLHDSNAALIAARAFPQVAAQEATVVSTGTWFVAMRSPWRGATPPVLPEDRDCLVNVDVFGQMVPSARFMGGREIETLSGPGAHRVDDGADQAALLAAVPAVLANGAMVLPTLVRGTGPFPHSGGRWIKMPADGEQLRAAVCLYAALVTDVALDLIGARERIIVEGRFAEALVFVKALAALRSDTEVYVTNAHNDVSFGALRLLIPDLAPQCTLIKVDPLDCDLTPYKAQWLRETEQTQKAA